MKKKRVNGPVAVKYEQLQSLQIKAAPETATKLYVQPQTPVPTMAEPAPGVETKVPEKPVPAGIEVAHPPTAPVQNSKATTGAKKSLLDTLRDQHITNHIQQNKQESIALTEKNLAEHWQCFITKLRDQNKNSVVTVFNIATIQVVNEQHFTVTVSTSLEQKFIEQEKMELLEYLKDCFHNRHIGFNILVKGDNESALKVDTTLSAREKYQKIIEQYPLVKELKDRLKLELDY